MAPEASGLASRVVGALRQATITGLIAFGLLLPLIGFNTVQNIRNELVLETRWPLLFTFVAILAGLRFLYLVVAAPMLAERARTASRPASPATLPSWAIPAVIGFVLVYP